MEAKTTTTRKVRTKKAVKRPKAGQPTSYKPEYCEIARKMCLLHADESRLADFFKVSQPTISNWKTRHPEFKAAIRAGKEDADASVASALANRALGYEVTETVEVQHGVFDYNERGEKILKPTKFTKTITKKKYPPDPTSMIFWLKNRHKDYWRDKREVTTETPEAEAVVIKTETISSDAIEAARQYAEMMK